MKTIFAMMLAVAFLISRPAFAGDEAPKAEKAAKSKKADKKAAKDEKKEEPKAEEPKKEEKKADKAGW
jgi:hypothetical protein